MIFGIDTASVAGNKNISWTRARAEGPISFALLRSNWGTSKDSMFDREWNRVLDAGMVAGAYMYLRFRTKKHGKAPAPRDQADAMISVLEKKLTKGRDLPPALDIEFPGGAVETGMKTEEIVDGVREAWTVLKDHYGIPPIIYTSGRVWKEDLKNASTPDLAASPLWLARYPFKKGPAIRDAGKVLNAKQQPVVPQSWGDQDNYWIHQYQGDATDVPGFPSGNVDMNRFHTASRGDRGGNVEWIQRRLGLPKVTGQFDKVTEDAVRTFQTKAGLTVDGVVGPRTFSALAWR